MKLTHALIEAGMTPAGGWTRAQLEILGVRWPPKRGWKDRLAGMEIEDGLYREFLCAARIRAKGRSRKQILVSEWIDSRRQFADKLLRDG